MKGRRTLYVLLAVVAIFAIIAVVGLMIYNKPHRAVKTSPPAYTMTAAQLVDEFSQDEASANALYAGKVIQLNGRLKDIIRDDSTVILLLGDTSALMSVSCYLMSDEEMKDTGLAPGKMVTVKGICNGVLMDVILDKAILLTDEIQ
ncbi:MAG TPA: hypothetical protein VFT90_16290 [Chryseosolibacter sp.]|nr:hypothetical protein [Chryseosolibacter sp.]